MRRRSMALRRTAWCIRDGDGNVMSIHRDRAVATLIATSQRGLVREEIKVQVYDNRVDETDAMYVPPDLPDTYWVETDVEEFRIGRSGEAYCCLYTGFRIAGTNEILYYINPPRRGRVEVTYSTPSFYTLYPAGGWQDTEEGV